MDLNIFKNLGNNNENNKVQDFIQELGEFLEDTILNKRNEVGILEQIQSERNTSLANKNAMDRELDNILLQYADKTKKDGALYFVAGKSNKNKETYVIYKYENGEDSIIKLLDKELPQNAGVNSVLRKKNSEYLSDENATNDVISQITQMANEILDKQDEQLQEYRKENHLYEVTENINGSVFLRDITDDMDYEIEEVDFPKELLKDGNVFKYENGEYRIEDKIS